MELIKRLCHSSKSLEQNPLSIKDNSLTNNYFVLEKVERAKRRWFIVAD